MATTSFDGTTLLLQRDLLHGDDDPLEQSIPRETETCLDQLAASIRRAFAVTDDEGALLVVEVDDIESDDPEHQATITQSVADIARSSIRKFDLLETLDSRTLAIGLPGSGRIGMTRVADAIRQRVGAAHVDTVDGTCRVTITIGAVHTTEAMMTDLDELLLAARVNLDAARAAGKNRTNWSDWTSTP